MKILVFLVYILHSYSSSSRRHQLENDKIKMEMDHKSCRVAKRTPQCDNCRTKRIGQRCLYLPKKEGIACRFLNAAEASHGNTVLEDGEKRKAQAPEIFEPELFEPQSRYGASVEMKEVFDIDGIATQQARKLAMQLNEMIIERNTLARKNKRLACQVQSLQRKKQAQSLKKGKQLTMESFFTRAGGAKEEEVDNTIIGEIEEQVGYDNNCDKTVRRHVAEMLGSITKITSGDGYKQLQLTAAIIDKIFDTNNGIKKELATLRVIGSSLLNFFDTLKSTYSGRYPNEVRASLQAVTAAITSKAPPGMLSFIARLTGASRFQMALASKKWDSWLEDSSRSLIELRGQIICRALLLMSE